jgi:hypothetical protein
MKKKSASKGNSKKAAAKNVAAQATASIDIKFSTPKAFVVYGSEASVSVYTKRKGNGVAVRVPLILKVGNKTYDKVTSDSFGYAHWNIRTTRALRPGDHEILVTFAGDNNFQPSSKTANLTVYIANSALRLEVEPTGNDRYELRGILRGAGGEPARKCSLEFIINNKSRGTRKTDDEGVARFDYHPTAPGNALTVKFDGNEFYRATSARKTF